MPQHDSILRRQCLRILTASSFGIMTGTVYTNPTDGAFQISVPQRPTRQDWPTFLGPARDGRSPQKIGNLEWGNGHLPLLWQKDLGEGYAIGSLSNGRFFQPHLQKGKEILDCLDAQTGERIWRAERDSEYRDLYGYDSGPRCSPVVFDNQVLMYGVDGVLTLREADSGKDIWRRDLNTDFGVVQNFFGVGSTPLIHRDKVLVMVGGSPEESAKVPPGALDRVLPNGSAIAALDFPTGKTLFQLGDDLASYSSPVIANLNGTPVGLAFCREGLLAFDPDKGNVYFHFPHRSSKLESVNAATPVVAGNQILLSETYGVGAVLLEVDSQWEPKVIWRDDPDQRERALEAHWNTPILYQGYLYASSGRHTGNAELRCVRWADGKVMWSQPGLARCSVTLANDQLVVLSERGNLILLKASPEKFQPITEHSFGDKTRPMRYPAWAAPIVADNKMWVRDVSRLFCFDIS